MDERLRFVARLLEGEPMSLLCREFGISRKTGYKIFDRYKEHGLAGLTDRSRRPVRYANQLPPQVETAIVRAKQDKPHWGARKIRELLVRRLAGEIRVPAKSTVHAVLDRHGLVKPVIRRRHASGTGLSLGHAPNDLWCADYKGEFKLGNQSYCYPLTVTDHASRYLLLCEALQSTREDLASTAFEHLFQERGLPTAIRSDNGVPFASANALFNLSRLAVWWLRLGIAIERIRPGRPQQNGRHERMHLTLKRAATRPAGLNSLQQQAKFDAFLQEFNTERPHEALAMKCPAEIYTPSPRPYRGLPEFSYPFHDREILVTACGRICLHRKKINLSTVKWRDTVTPAVMDELMLGEWVYDPPRQRSGRGVWYELNRGLPVPHGLRQLQRLLSERAPDEYAAAILSMDRAIALRDAPPLPRSDLVLVAGDAGALRKPGTALLSTAAAPPEYTAGRELQVVELVLHGGGAMIDKLYAALWSTSEANAAA